MAIGGEAAGRDPFGELLIARGLATEAQLDEAYQRQRERGIPLGQLLVEMGVLGRLELAGLLAEQWAGQATTTASARPLRPVHGSVGVQDESSRSEPPGPDVMTGAGAVEKLATELRERLEALGTRLDQVERDVSVLTARLDGQADAAPREALEELRQAMAELWKVQKRLLEGKGTDSGGSRAA